jgi:hypothetical protein
MIFLVNRRDNRDRLSEDFDLGVQKRQQSNS